MPTVSAMRHLRVFWGKKTLQDTEFLLSDMTVGDSPKGIFTSLGMNPKRKNANGWRFSVVMWVLLGVSIFSLNLGLTIWASTGFSTVEDVAIVYEGSCSKVKNSITWIHLAINILSTLLLAASNFCMQILCAPTREEVDAAHARRKWLSIGVPSFNNLFYVERKKAALWIILGLTSVPLHLLWNSAFVNTLSSNDYVFNAVTEGFLNGLPYNNTLGLNRFPDAARSMREQLGNHSLVSLSVPDCIRAYGLNFNTEYGNLLLVYDTEGDNNSLLLQGLNKGNQLGGGPILSGAGLWMCGTSTGDPTPYTDEWGSYCDFGELIKANATHWNPWSDFAFEGYTDGVNLTQTSFTVEGNVKTCLVEKTDRPCRLGISPPILITVLLCNAVKTICFISVLYVGGSMHPLVTNGDAIQSFLSRPDTSLKGRCLVSKVDVKNKKHFWSEQPLPLQWRGRKRRWAAGATKGFWLSTFIPALILIATILGIALQRQIWTGGTRQLVKSGLGRPDTTHLLGQGAYGGVQSPAAGSLLANTPQIIVSYIYIAYNCLFTSMLSNAEWVGYSVHQKGLCVAWPRGQQRARGFLQLPYLYAVPIMVASTILHWLISQSLFLVRIYIYNYDGTHTSGGLISATGYSPYATVFALSLGGAMLVAALLLGFLKTYPATMPLAACCSASIAAACQPREDMAKDELTLERLQWGVVDGGTSVDGDDRVEHACFSAKEVTPLVAGRYYT